MTLTWVWPDQLQAIELTNIENLVVNRTEILITDNTDSCSATVIWRKM